MDWIDKLEKRLGGLAVQNLALYLVFGQVIVWTFTWFNILPLELFYLNPVKVMQGEVWRVFTFIFIPPERWGPIFLAFAWYIFWMISQALEGQWGTFRYNLFIWLGILFTLVLSLVIPNYWYSNYYIHLTVFLAFATLYPDFEFRIYFILPVKVKWLALISLAYPIMNFVAGPWPIRIVILASMANYLLFFGKDLYQVYYLKKRRTEHKKKTEELAEEAFHTCTNCGATDKSNPERAFRYREGKGICEVCLEKEVETKA